MWNQLTRLILAVLAITTLLPMHLSATAYTAVASGHFNSNSTWSPSGHPMANDTFTIPSGFTVTCDSSDGGCTAGLAASSCTVDAEVQMGAALTIGDGGLLTMEGELDFDQGAVLNVTATSTAATLAIRPGSGATCSLHFENDAGSGAAQWNMRGASTSIVAEVKGDLSGGGKAFVIENPSGETMPVVSWNYAEIVQCGNSSAGITCGNGYPFLESGTVSVNNLLVMNTYSFDLGFQYASSVAISNVSFVNPAGSFVGTWSSSTALTSASFKNITCYEDTAVAAQLNNPPLFTLTVNSGQCGYSSNEGDSIDAACFQAYNCTISHAATASGQNMIDRESWIVVDGQMNADTPGVMWGGQSQNNQLFEDGIAYTHWLNPHQWTSAANSGGTINQYRYNIADGDGYAHGDTGNLFEDNGNYVVSYNINIYGAGELDSDQNTSTTAHQDIHNTSHEAYGVSLGNFGVQYNPMFVKDNLFTFPYDPNTTSPQEGPFQTGLTVQSTYARQNQTDWPNYNGYYGMMGSGDTDPVSGSATTCGHGTSSYPCPLPNETTGTTVSYVGVPTPYVGSDSSCGTTTGTTSTTVVFSTCSTTGIQPGDFVVQHGGTMPFATVASVTAPSTLTLTGSGISGLSSGDSVQVNLSYWNTPSSPGILYGTTAGYGTNDIHADPDYTDSTRNLCSYYVRVGSGTANCYWQGNQGGNGGYFISTSISGTTLISDNSEGIDFLSLGISTNDWVTVYQGGTTNWRCTEPVTAVEPGGTQLQIGSCSGLSSGDAFTFISGTRHIGQAIVTLNGWSYQGNPTTPASWATTLQAWDWIRNGFRPTNRIYKGAADDGSDIGAVPLLREPPPLGHP